MLEIAAHHIQALTMRQTIRMQRDQHAASDCEQPEGQPHADKRQKLLDRRLAARSLRAGEQVDDAPEKIRFGKLRHREQQVGNHKHKRKLALRAEHGQNTEVEARQRHRGIS